MQEPWNAPHVGGWEYFTTGKAPNPNRDVEIAADMSMETALASGKF